VAELLRAATRQTCSAFWPCWAGGCWRRDAADDSVYRGGVACQFCMCICVPSSPHFVHFIRLFDAAC
jgi:hypothetical protein